MAEWDYEVWHNGVCLGSPDDLVFTRRIDGPASVTVDDRPLTGSVRIVCSSGDRTHVLFDGERVERDTYDGWVQRCMAADRDEIARKVRATAFNELGAIDFTPQPLTWRQRRKLKRAWKKRRNEPPVWLGPELGA